jgi:hypothetical protein
MDSGQADGQITRVLTNCEDIVSWKKFDAVWYSQSVKEELYTVKYG